MQLRWKTWPQIVATMSKPASSSWQIEQVGRTMIREVDMRDVDEVLRIECWYVCVSLEYESRLMWMYAGGLIRGLSVGWDAINGSSRLDGSDDIRAAQGVIKGAVKHLMKSFFRAPYPKN
jgi:hypothetical protein